MELSGPWRARLATDDLRRSGVGLDTDDSSWTEVSVPGHWQDHAEFATNTAPVLYRTRFDLPIPDEHQRAWAVLDGVFYQADVSIDGAYLGDPEGYFIPHAFDITDLARLGEEHVLAVEVACAPQTNRTSKRNLTGAFQHHEFGGPPSNPGGIWRPVHIETTGHVRIDAVRVLCRDAHDGRAHLRLHARLDSDRPVRVELRTVVDGVPVAQREYPLATGRNDVDWTVDVSNPRLWWPWTLGEAQLTDVRIDVWVDDELSHRRDVRTGLREVGFDHWRFSINGEQLFTLGANLAPTTMLPAHAAPAGVRHDLQLAKEAGLNLVRVQGHVGVPELYDVADEMGMLVWQDMPLQWGYSRSVRRQAVRQAEELVNVLGHHPSIVLWCGHNEPLDLRDTRADALRGGVAWHIVREQRPSWNELLLDPWIKRAVERVDESRPAVSHSDLVPRPPVFSGGDSHLFFGWFHGEADDLGGFAAAVPRMVQFVSDFGAPAASTAAQSSFTEATRPDLSPFDVHVPRDGISAERWVTATQQYQAELLRTQIETLRRLKYHPTGGFAFSALYDPVDDIGFGILDVHRRPKLGYQAVVDACRPVIVVADRLPAQVAPGDTFALDLHVVSELRDPVEDARCTATLRWPGGSHRWSFSGDVDADSVVRIGTIQAVVPDTTGDLMLDLDLQYGDGAASNRYRSVITRPA